MAADQRPLGVEVAAGIAGNDEAVGCLLANRADDQRAARGLAGARRKAQRACERVFALADDGLPLLNAKEGAGKALVNTEPDQEQSQNEQVRAAKHEALRLETLRP